MDVLLKTLRVISWLTRLLLWENKS